MTDETDRKVRDAMISIHTPAKGVTSTSTPARSKFLNFNPHSREGSDGGKCLMGLKDFDFNPHSREGSDGARRFFITKDCISIHTPAKGVTSSP